MSAERLYRVLAESFNRNEYKELAQLVDHDDPERMTSERLTLSNIAIDFIDYANRHYKTLLLLDSIHDLKPYIDLSPYLHFLVGEPGSPYTTEEVRDWYLEHCANPNGTYFETQKQPQAKRLQEFYWENGRRDEFYDLVAQRIPAVGERPYLKAFQPHPPPKPPEPEKEPAPQYANFDIFIGTQRADGRYEITASTSDNYQTDSPSWQALPVDNPQYKQTLASLADLLASEADTEWLGNELYQFLFPQEVQKVYFQLRQRTGDQVRIRIHIPSDSPELHAIPWEYCTEDMNFMATNPETPTVRFIPLAKGVAAEEKPDVIRILVVMASPSGWGKIDLPAERARIEAALQPLVEAGEVQLQFETHATKSTFSRTFRAFKPHILHFVGHGKYRDADGEGVIVVEDGSGGAAELDAKDMNALMRMVRGLPKLVIMAACKTAVSGDATPQDKHNAGFLGMGTRLIRAGIPAVIAMQYAIPSETASDFTHHLYQYLADGHPLDYAITQARFDIYFNSDDKVFWAIPALFIRSENGHIW